MEDRAHAAPTHPNPSAGPATRFDQGKRVDTREHPVADAATIRAAQDLVARSGVIDLLDGYRQQDLASGRVAAHRPWLDPLQVLTVLLVCARFGRTSVSSIAALLSFGMDGDALDELGVRLRPGGTPRRVHGRVYTSVSAVESLFDVEGTNAPACLGDRAQALLNALLRAQFLGSSEPCRTGWRGDVAVDSTFLRLRSSLVRPRSLEWSAEMRSGQLADESAIAEFRRLAPRAGLAARREAAGAGAAALSVVVALVAYNERVSARFLAGGRRGSRAGRRPCPGTV